MPWISGSLWSSIPQKSSTKEFMEFYFFHSCTWVVSLPIHRMFYGNETWTEPFNHSQYLTVIIPYVWWLILITGKFYFHTWCADGRSYPGAAFNHAALFLDHFDKTGRDMTVICVDYFFWIDLFDGFLVLGGSFRSNDPTSVVSGLVPGGGGCFCLGTEHWRCASGSFQPIQNLLLFLNVLIIWLAENF